MLLATVAKEDSRNELTKNALKHGWNVRELRKELRGGAAKGKTAPTKTEPQSELPRGLATAIENYVAQVAGLTGNAATFGEHLVQKIGQTEPADLTDAVVDRLTGPQRRMFVQAFRDFSAVLLYDPDVFDDRKKKAGMDIACLNEAFGPVRGTFFFRREGRFYRYRAGERGRCG